MTIKRLCLYPIAPTVFLSYRITRMRIKQTFLTLAAAITMGILAFGSAPVAFAQEECAGVETAIISCDQTGGSDAATEESGVWGLLLLALNILTAGVGIAAVGGIVWAAILYSGASDNMDQVKQAKEIIKNVAIGLVAYALMYLVLNFLIPGGIFSAPS